jgi:hypothetical protein
LATNLTIFPVDTVAVVYLQDGSSVTVQPQDTKNLQLIDGGFCTISDTVSAEEGEHPPEKLAEAWKAFWKVLDEVATGPEAIPL